MTHLLSNIYTKNYWNWTITVKIIVGGWVVYFLGHSVDKMFSNSRIALPGSAID